MRPGSIVLAHDAGDDPRLTTVRGLAMMIDDVPQRGFRLVTVPELLAAETTATSSGRPWQRRPGHGRRARFDAAAGPRRLTGCPVLPGVARH